MSFAQAHGDYLDPDLHGDQAQPRPRRKHQLLTPATCPCVKESDHPCVVCDGGLAVCRICGQAENELAEECPGGSDETK